MENYILILLTILVVLVIAIVAIGYRKIEHLRTNVNRNTANINALQSYISKVNSQSSLYGGSSSSKRHIIPDEIDVSDSESDDLEDFIKERYYDDDKDDINSSSNDETATEASLEDEVRRVVELSEVFSEEELHNEKVVDENFVEESVGKENTLEEDVTKDDITNETAVEETDDDVKSITFGSQKKAKKVSMLPSDPAKNYDVGHREKSSKDDNTYEVIETKTGVKRWKKVDN